MDTPYELNNFLTYMQHFFPLTASTQNIPTTSEQIGNIKYPIGEDTVLGAGREVGSSDDSY